MKQLTYMSIALAGSSLVSFPTVAIAQANPGTISLACGSVVEGQTAQCQFQLTGGTVQFSGAVSGAASVPDFNTAIDVVTIDDKLVNGTRQLPVAVTYGAQNATAAVTVTDNDKQCSDGSIIDIGAACPPDVTPERGGPAIASEFDPQLGLKTNSTIPKSAYPDVVGAFRFICGAGQVLPDDPIVFPGRPGASHLHQFYGNTDVNAFSTHESLRKHGTSTCNNGTQYTVNRSGYWMPAMLNGVGQVVQPDYVSIYYKRRPAIDPKCSLTSGDPKAIGNCVQIPNGLKFIMGFNMLTGTNPGSGKNGSYHYNCQGPAGQGAIPGNYYTLTDAIAHCPYVPGATKQNQLGAIVSAQDCWDGKNLDSADHRSHVSYAGYGSWGYLKCDAAHPYVIPTFTLGAWYSVDANLAKWHLSSDEMMPNLAPGTTFHADYLEAWDPSVKATWTKNGCIDKMLNCSAGELGNGQSILGADKPAYGWLNPHHTVPMP